MSFLVACDYALAFGQGLLALMLWHRAEPRMREARGPWQSLCTLALGFVLAWSFPLVFSRALSDAHHTNWQWTIRDAFLLLYAACLYRHAMTLKPREAV